MLILEDAKTEYTNDAELRIRPSLYEREKIAGSEKATEARKEKALHRSILLEPDTSNSTEKPELRGSKHQLI